MKLQVIDFPEVVAELSDSTGPIAIIIAPNFEARSNSVCQQLVLDLEHWKISPGRIHWFVLTLQGGHTPEILDALKSIHARAALSVLREAGYDRERVTHRIIPYPISSELFASQIAELFRAISSEAELIVDFSALPRNLLSSLLRQVSVSGRHETPFPTVKRAWLTYAWAAAYPENAGPEFVGGITGHFSQFGLRDLLSGKTHAEIVLFTSGSGHDSFEVLEATRAAGLGNQINIHLVNFIHNENFHESYHNLRNHYGLILEAKKMGANIRYVFSIGHALQFMREIADACAIIRNTGNATLFALAPFGPKPLAVAAHFVRQEYLARLNEPRYVEADVLNSSGTQYLSPYSLGFRSLMAFRYEPTETYFE